MSAFISLISSHLISLDLTLFELSVLQLVAATANWVVRCEATRFAVAAISGSLLGLLYHL